MYKKLLGSAIFCKFSLSSAGVSISRSNIMLRKKAEAIVAKYLSRLRLPPGKYLYQFIVATLHSERGCKYPQIAGCCENVYETYYEIVDNC
jgi:hypothetical protein